MCHMLQGICKVPPKLSEVMDNWCADHDGEGVRMQVAIYAGRGSKRQISAKPIRQIIGRMRPLLQQQRYGEALEGAAVDIGIAMAGGSTPGGDGGGPSLRVILALLFVVGVFATIIIIICIIAGITVSVMVASAHRFCLRVAA